MKKTPIEKLEVVHKGATIDVTAIVAVDEEDLKGEFVRHAALLALWTLRYEEAADAFRKAEVDLQATHARLSSGYRDAYESTGQKATEGRIDALIDADDDYVAARKEVLTLRYRADVLKGLVRALEDRGRMLVALGGIYRAEFGALGMKV